MAMPVPGGVMRVGSIVLVVACLGLLQVGCATLEQNVALGVGGVTALGARSPTHEIEQIYYLGVFDPQEQVPPTVYRVRVHGQASMISFMRFASGWVPATLIDSLGTGVKFSKESESISITPADANTLSTLQTGRRLMLFGPEGFREAPKDHRLVIIMGSNPEAFFQAVDQSLGVISDVADEQQQTALALQLSQALLQIQNEHERLDELARDIAIDVPAPKGSEQ